MTLTQGQIDAIKALEDTDGRVTPQQVVDAAREKGSPLHPLFDWNARSAASKWWLVQAREIIGAVKYQVHTTETAYKVSGYVRDTEVDGQGYRSVTALRANPSSARESLIYTLEVAAGHLRRALDLAGPLGLAGDVDQLLQQIAGVQRVIEKAA